MNIYQKSATTPFSVIDTTLPVDKPLLFRKNIKTNHDN